MPKKETREEKLGLTVKKSKNFSEWYTQVIKKAELADVRYNVQGFIVHRPWGFLILRKIYEFLEKEVEKDGHLPFLFPLVVPKKNLMIEKEHAGFTPDVFWVTKAGNEKLEEKLALRPTGESQIYPMYSLWLRSYQDLPFKGYQSRINVYRNEKTTRPFLRGREFMFFETHDVFRDHKEALKQIKKDKEICETVIKKEFKIPFLFFKRPQWDKFKGANDTYTPDTMMPDGRRNQLASTHDLGQRFAKAYKVKFKKENGKEVHAWQTCFGPGIWRIMAALIAVHGDDKGLILPFDVAPLQIVIIPIVFSRKQKLSEKIFKKCYEIKKKIKKTGYRVKVDNSENSPGYKYNHWELCGTPLRIEIGPKEVNKNNLTIVLRNSKNKEKISIKNIKKEIEKFAGKVDKKIEIEAKNYFKNNTRDAKSLNELISLIKKYKGFIKVPFCSMEKDGEKCADILKAETEGGNVCGTIYPKENEIKQNQKCIICGKKAKHIVYIAKSY